MTVDVRTRIDGPRPDFDPDLLHQSEVEIVVQINGKVRGRVFVAFGTAKEALEKQALGDSKIQALLDGKQVVKVIVVPDKLVNIVVK